MTAVPILDSARDLVAGYDVLFCDVWGVVHNGHTAYRDACTLLAAVRRQGSIVVLVSNAPRTAASVARILAEKNVPTDSWDAIVSSGDVALAHVAARGFRTVHHIGPNRDLDLFDNIETVRGALPDSEAIVATGLVDDRVETGEDYRAPLAPARARGLPLICANPDLVVDVAGTLLPCAGAIAAVYEDMGGDVFWAGKPHHHSYERAMAIGSERLGRPVEKQRILAIGDAVRTDLEGAGRFGIDALFIGQGIHREAVMPAGRIERDALERLLDGTAYRPVAAMASLG